MKKLLATLALVGFLLPLSYGISFDLNADYNNHILGNVQPPQPAGDAEELNRLNNLINFHNTATDPSGGGYTYSLGWAGAKNPNLPGILPTASTQESKINTSSLSLIIPVGVSYDYLLVKSSNEIAEYFYIGGLVGDGSTALTYERQGFSHYALYNGRQVPDSGMTLILLGASLAALGFLKRRRK